METLRRAHRLTRLLLAWFVFSVGTALASPLLHPDGGDVICGGAGHAATHAAAGDAKGSLPADHLEDCSSCVMVGAPVVVPLFAAADLAPQVPDAQRPVSFSPRIAAAFLARGPPGP